MLMQKKCHGGHFPLHMQFFYLRSDSYNEVLNKNGIISLLTKTTCE